MKRNILICLIYFVFTLGVSGKTFAQNILNDTLYVSISSITEITFNAPIDKTVMPNGDGSYETSVSGNTRSILVNAARKNAKVQPLIVNEGTREHKFVLLFKDSLPPKRIDWSNLKNLRAHIARNQLKTIATSDPVASARPPKTTTSNADSVQQKQAGQAKAEDESQKENNTLIEADVLFRKGLWQEAKLKYRQVKDPGLANFVSFRMNEINNKLEEEGKKQVEQQRLSERIQSEKKFNDYLYTGGEALKNRNVPAARTAFNEALKIRPGDPNVISLLAKVDNLEKEPRKNENLQKIDSLKTAEYYKAIYIADRFYDAKDFNFAREEYKRAARIFPDSTYPANQIKKISRVQPDSSKNKVIKAGNN